VGVRVEPPPTPVILPGRGPMWDLSHDPTKGYGTVGLFRVRDATRVPYPVPYRRAAPIRYVSLSAIVYLVNLPQIHQGRYDTVGVTGSSPVPPTILV
jgi:hypothetical protein